MAWAQLSTGGHPSQTSQTGQGGFTKMWPRILGDLPPARTCGIRSGHQQSGGRAYFKLGRSLASKTFAPPGWIP